MKTNTGSLDGTRTRGIKRKAPASDRSPHFCEVSEPATRSSSPHTQLEEADTSVPDKGKKCGSASATLESRTNEIVPPFFKKKTTVNEIPSSATPIPQESRMKEFIPIDSDTYKRARQIAEANNGQVTQSPSSFNGDGATLCIGFRCPCRHVFKSSLEQARTIWCPLCKERTSICREEAATNNGSFHGLVSSKEAQFGCSRGHMFRLSFVAM